jgi:plastocyanin
LILLAVAAAAALAMACSDDDDGVEEEVIPSANDLSQPLQITATDFAFDPETFDSDAGAAVELVVTNAGDADHTFTIDEVEIDETIAPGDEITVSFDMPSSNVEYYCRFHSEMTGTILAGAGGGGTTDGATGSPGTTATEEASDGATPGGATPDETDDDDDDDDDDDNSGSGSDNSGSSGYYGY